MVKNSFGKDKLMKMNLNKIIKKNIVEAVDKKESFLIETTIVKNRITSIIDKKTMANFDSLSEIKKDKIATILISEIIEINQSGLLKEDLGDVIKGLFGSALPGVWKTISEKLVNSLLSALGVEDSFLKQVAVQYFSNHPIDAIKSFGDCRMMTELLVKAIIEAAVASKQQQIGKGGVFYDTLRNAIFDYLDSNETVNKLSDAFEDLVCKMLGTFTNKAKSLMGSLQSTPPNVSPAT
jgi:hypothetical protein